MKRTRPRIAAGFPESCAICGIGAPPVAGAAISVDSVQAATADAGGNYQMRVLTFGQHNIRASKAGFRSLTQSLTVTDMGASYTLDFKAITGLVPDVLDLSFVLNCINKWKFPPDGGFGLDVSKLLNIINAWKFPI